MIRSLALVACALLSLAPVTVRAAYPDRAVHIVVGFAPGAAVDTITRVIAQKLSEKWHQPVLVDNREGANGVLAADYVAHAAPDGYNLLGASAAFMVPGGDIKLNYDPIKSFTPISLVATQPSILLANPSLPVNSVKDLVALAKSKPGQLNFSSAGTGSPAYLQMALLMQQTGIDMVNVSYKGVGPAVVAAISGEVQLCFASVIAASEQVKAGKLKALAVTTNVRAPSLPDVPTVAESAGIGDFNEGNWDGLFGPAHLPQPMVDQINRDIVDVIKSPDIQERLKALGNVGIGNTPGEFADFLVKDLTKWEALIKTLPK